MAMTPSVEGSYDGPMPDRDPAFLWETEALRTVGAQGRETGRHVRPEPAVVPGGDWVTLREASDATGIPVATLRSWIRKKRLPSKLDQTENGDLRLVQLDRVLARADQLGREVEVVDLRRDRVTIDRAPGPTTVEAAPPGTMIVPIEAWDKMLIQLGNLHEAGQQLAEARERAARAETEASFLRERLADLRTGGPADIPAEAAAEVMADDRALAASVEKAGERPSFTVYLWRSTMSRLRRS